MKVVLNQDVKGLGKKLQIVEVSEGYARNFLLPKKLANIADNKNLNEAKTKQEALKYKKDMEFEEAVGTGNRLFGSVTEKEISEKLKEKLNIDINKKKIILKDQIKQLGNYIADVKLHEGVVAKLKIVVVGM